MALLRRVRGVGSGRDVAVVGVGADGGHGGDGGVAVGVGGVAGGGLHHGQFHVLRAPRSARPALRLRPIRGDRVAGAGGADLTSRLATPAARTSAIRVCSSAGPGDRQNDYMSIASLRLCGPDCADLA